MKKPKGKTNKSKPSSGGLKKKGTTNDESLNASSDGVLDSEGGETTAALRTRSYDGDKKPPND